MTLLHGFFEVHKVFVRSRVVLSRDGTAEKIQHKDTRYAYDNVNSKKKRMLVHHNIQRNAFPQLS